MKESELNDYRSDIDDVVCKLEAENEISMYDYMKYIDIKEKIEKSSDISSEEFNIKILIEKIKTDIEKIKTIIKDKKKHEYIKEYFTNDNAMIVNDIDLSLVDSKNKDDINDEYIKKISAKSMNSIDSVLPLLSSFYLKEKLYLSGDEISSIKKDFDFDNGNLIEEKENEKENKERKEEDNFLKKYHKSKSLNSNKTSSHSSHKEIDAEMEKEITNQIFGYTKTMKENAKHFGAQLKRDNSVLNEIEKVQNVDQEKTDVQVKKLKEFNYSLRIGFFKLIFMFLIVFVTFAFTLLTMRIFPKLA